MGLGFPVEGLGGETTHKDEHTEESLRSSIFHMWYMGHPQDTHIGSVPT